MVPLVDSHSFEPYSRRSEPAQLQTNDGPALELAMLSGLIVLQIILNSF